MNSIRRFIQNIRSLLSARTARLHLLVYFLAAMAFLGAFVRTDYATDTYADIMLSAQELIDNFLRGGRLFTLAGFVVFRGLHIPVQVVSLLSFLLAVGALVAALYLLEKIIRRNLVSQKYWPMVLSFLIIFNPFIIELFLFVEKGVMVTGILLCVVAAYDFNEYIEKAKPKFLVLAFVLNILATFCYQGVVGLFIVIATLLVVLKSKSWKIFFKNTLLSVLAYISGPVVNLVFIKIFSSGGRASGEVIWPETFAKIVDGAKSLLQIFEIIPSICFWGAICFLMITWLAYCFRQHKLMQKLTLLTAVQIIYLALVIILAAIAPQLVQNSASIWIVPRSTYVFASLYGVFLVVILSNYRQLLYKKWCRMLIIIPIGFFMIAQYLGFNRIIIDHYTVNALDRLRAEQIGRMITAYEDEHQTTITTIMPAADANLTYMYDGLFVKGDINVSAFIADWSDVSSVNYWNYRHFTRQAPDADWQAYCAERDWANFSVEQYEFDGQTLKVCWY